MQDRAEEAPEVSVIIPTHDQRQEQTSCAIRSALSQRGVSLEVIVVDDGSNPPFMLPSDLQEMANLRVVRREVNGGAAAARNQGVAAAHGKWLAFLDSDDNWREDKLIQQLDLAGKQKHGGPIVVSTGFRLIAEEEKVRRRRRRALVPAPADKLATFAGGCWFCPGSTALMERDVFRVVGPFDTNLKRLEDLDWYLRFAMRGGRLVVTPLLLVDVHVGGRPSAAIVRVAAKQLRDKYKAVWGTKERSAKRALAAYLALEQSAACWYERRLAQMLWYLLRSWLLVPRWRLHLRSFWQHVDDPMFRKSAELREQEAQSERKGK